MRSKTGAPDGEALLVSSSRDHYWRSAQRLFLLPLEEGATEKLVFDAYASDASISPDGKKILFVREGERWWRKGYTGARSAQVWLYDVESGEYEKLLDREGDCRWPVWAGDNTAFYYTNGDVHGFDLWRYNLGDRADDYVGEAIVEFSEDSITHPTVARDGSLIVFRRLFDLYRFRPGLDAAPKKLEIYSSAETAPSDVVRRTVNRASSATFSADGLEMAFTAGGDAFVMDTELKEPVNLGPHAAEESEVVFSADGDSLPGDQRSRGRERHLPGHAEGQRNVLVAEQRVRMGQAHQRRRGRTEPAGLARPRSRVLRPRARRVSPTQHQDSATQRDHAGVRRR